MGWEHVLLQPSGEAEASLDLRHNMVEILCVYAEAAEVRNFFYLWLVYKACPCKGGYPQEMFGI